MSDRALTGADASPIRGVRYEDLDATHLVMAEAPTVRRYSLRSAAGDLPAIEEALAISLPQVIGGCSLDGESRALKLGPDEWYLTVAEAADDTEDARPKTPSGVTCSLIDVSDRDLGIRISGRAAAETLCSGCPLDLWSLEPGRATRSIFEQASIILIKPAPDLFDVVVWRSFAPYVWTILHRAARQNAGLGQSLRH